MKVLIADDQPLDRSMLQLTLAKWNYDVIECEDGISALEIIQGNKPPQIVILDWMMPGLTGPEIIEKVRGMKSQKYIYILLLTAKDEKSDIIEGLESGADDYIVKSVDIHELQMRLRAGIRIIELQHQLMETQEKLRIQATRDYLTGLWIRASIMEILSREFAVSHRENQPVGVVMADLDSFKKVNDSYGHTTGDAVLCEVARRISDSIRPYDSVGRYGGEEFLIILHKCDAEETKNIAERVREAMCSVPIKSHNYEGNITVSLGGISRIVTTDTPPNDLINIADSELYKAKEAGRNRVKMV